MPTNKSDVESVYAELSRLAESADRVAQWPSESWQCLSILQALKWTLPAPFGLEMKGVPLWELLQSLAAVCTTSAFIWTQRESACRHIAERARPGVREELLGQLAEGTIFATVGLAHLTTSRQHVSPALVATEDNGGFTLHGVMPWVSGAGRADYFVTGAVLADSGLQILLILPRASTGVTVAKPMDLMALAGSITTEVTCSRVHVERKWVLGEPAERVLTLGRRGTGGLETACLALGLSEAAINFLVLEAKQRPELLPTTEHLMRRRSRVRKALYSMESNEASPQDVAMLRGRANALVLQSTQTALTASKGTGFRHPHPAQRWARQALFFLVWSCPWPAASATLDALIGQSSDCESAL